MSRAREARRLDRQLSMVSRNLPWISWAITAIRPGGRASLLRSPIGVLLIAGGLLSFLPLLGIWMLPLGLLLLAVDVPWLRAPVSGFTIRGRRYLRRKVRSRPCRTTKNSPLFFRNHQKGKIS